MLRGSSSTIGERMYIEMEIEKCSNDLLEEGDLPCHSSQQIDDYLVGKHIAAFSLKKQINFSKMEGQPTELVRDEQFRFPIKPEERYFSLL